mmetsp:Transcript_14677/g.40418  ORF Transcript_14677/g.40418 Transcript_14677/m.40418 type:complete len:416 (-) Transcript_14677:120-1367(-)
MAGRSDGPGEKAATAVPPHEPLVLKVMRLRRPIVEPPAGLVPCSANGTCLAPGGVLDVSSDVPKLLLPMSLTQSLVGEPFSGYLHLANCSKEAVQDVTLRVDMQVGNSRVALFDNSSRPLASIAPGDFFDIGVKHDLQDAGTYVLTCSVSYGTPTTGKPGVFKRSYRFPALQPFAVAHRVAQIGPRLLVECSVENATANSLFLTSWHLECADGLEVSAVPSIWTPSAVQPPMERRHCTPQLLRPRGSHSLLFVVTPMGSGSGDGEADAVRRLRELDLVGHLALGWHMPDGPSGCVEGHQVRLTPVGNPGIELRIVSRPERVHVEAPFQLEAEVTNRTDQAVEPSIIFEQRLLGALRVNGATRQAVGRLEPHASSSLTLEFLATSPGLHSLRGLLLIDDLSKSKVEFGTLCEVVVF